jgi:hypothetical protein
MGLAGKTQGVSGDLAPVLWAQGRREEVLAYVGQDVRIALDLAQVCESRGELRWVARSGKVRSMALPQGWLTVTPLPAQSVKPPLIAECPVNLECRLLDDPEPIGDHDLFKGEVLVEYVDAELIDEQGDLRTERLDMLIFARWTFWTAGKQIGVRG